MEGTSSSSTTLLKEKVHSPNEVEEGENEEEEEGEICMICHENFENGEELRRLMCMCSYHKSCIDKWLESHDTCPVDRRNIIHPNGDNDEGHGNDGIQIFN